MGRDRADVVIVGAGPAGLALAHALRARNVDVLVVAPETRWRATYGAWRDDVNSCELGAPLDSLVRGAWPVVRVVGAQEHRLERPYVVFDNQRLNSSLSTGIATRDDTVLSADHDMRQTTLRLASGRTVVARLVVDATGAGTLLAHRATTASAGAQTAYGLVVHDTAQVQPGVFTLMDWRTPVVGAATFFYGARFSDGTALIEETSLYAQPPREVDELRQMLSVRVGSDLTSQALAVERVHIPMGNPLPARTTRVVGFGAAVGYIHPVTGYSVAGSLRAAPRVADAIASALRADRTGADLASVVWGSVWPTHLLQTRAWHDAGLHALRRLPGTSLGAFFDGFFSLPVELWSSYLRIDSEPAVVRRAMFELFRRSGWALRVRLAASPGALLRALAAR
jgi:lycopene beta-cyclase